MSQPYIGQIALVAFNFAPAGWALCNGQLMAITQNDALFSLIGTIYGGDGQTTFALPNLQSRVPIHMGQGPGLSTYNIGQVGGVESVTLSVAQIPSHTHLANCASGTTSAPSPSGAIWAIDSGSDTPYKSLGPAGVSMMNGAIGAAGGSQPHENRQPFLAINYIISLFGIFPSQ